MKILTVIAQQVSAEALNAALPAEGVICVTVSETQSFSRTPTTVGSYRGVKLPQHFTPVFRIEVLIEDEEGNEMVLAYLNTGQFFGEMGLFHEQPARSAWVRERVYALLCRSYADELSPLTDASIRDNATMLLKELKTKDAGR